MTNIAPCKQRKYTLFYVTSCKALKDSDIMCEGMWAYLRLGRYSWNHRTAAAIILKLTYGIRIDEHVDEEGDNYVSLADKALSRWMLLLNNL